MTDQFVEDNDLQVPTMIPGTVLIPLELVQFINKPIYGVDV